MTAGELQEECARRGLPSSRAAKAVMVQRLLDDDTEVKAPDETGPVTPDGPSADEYPAGAPVRSFRKTFTAEPDGPDEETHLAYRQATVQAAAEEGLVPRGDARLADTRGGVWVYEVSVRQGA